MQTWPAASRARALLVIDNCEHLIQATAALARTLIERCPHLQLLVTSREPLMVKGEVTFQVSPLPIPAEGADLERIGEADATRLLVARAAEARPGFSLTARNAQSIASICRRLDGIPLALELAATRLRVLTPEQVLTALSDRFRLLDAGTSSSGLERHRTLEASFEWSYDLLGEDEQSVLRRLSIFPGSFDLAAAETVCGDSEVEAYAVLDVLTRLVDRSLVVADLSAPSARYCLLETIRSYARQRLAETEQLAKVRDRHLRHYAQRLREIGPELASADARVVHERVAVDLANVRGALDWAMESGRARDAIALIESSQAFWAMSGLQPEAYERLAITLGDEELELASRVTACATGARFAVTAGAYREAVRFAEQGLALAREGEDVGGLCDALSEWGWTACQAGAASADECLAALDEACALAERLDDPLRLWQATTHRTSVSILTVRGMSGVTQLEGSLELAREIGSPLLVAISHVYLAMGNAVRGRYDEARRHAMLCLQCSEGLILGAHVAMAHTALAICDLVTGDLDAAEGHFQRSREAAFVSGRRLHAEYEVTDHHRAELSHRRGDLGEAARLIEAAIANAQERGDANDLCGSLHQAGVLALASGDDAKARRVFEEAAALARAGSWWAWAGWAQLGLAWLARRQDRHAQGWTHAHEALDHFRGREVPIHTALTLETLGGLAATLGRPELGARLLGASERLLGDRGYVRDLVAQSERDQARAAVEDVLGAQRFAGAFEEGRALSMDEAVQLVRRWRGRRKRPPTGWNSLTPAELDVAALVVEGLTNQEIARRLFVSVNTVKSHLAQSFGKLGISSRAQLAAEAARRTAAARSED